MIIYLKHQPGQVNTKTGKEGERFQALDTVFTSALSAMTGIGHPHVAENSHMGVAHHSLTGKSPEFTHS